MLGGSGIDSYIVSVDTLSLCRSWPQMGVTSSDLLTAIMVVVVVASFCKRKMDERVVFSFAVGIYVVTTTKFFFVAAPSL